MNAFFVFTRNTPLAVSFQFAGQLSSDIVSHSRAVVMNVEAGSSANKSAGGSAGVGPVGMDALRDGLVAMDALHWCLRRR